MVGHVEVDFHAGLRQNGEAVTLMSADIRIEGEQAAVEGFGALAVGIGKEGAAANLHRLVDIADRDLGEAAQGPARQEAIFAFQADLPAVEYVARLELVAHDDLLGAKGVIPRVGDQVLGNVQAFAELQVPVTVHQVQPTAGAAPQFLPQIDVGAPQAQAMVHAHRSTHFPRKDDQFHILHTD